MESTDEKVQWKGGKPDNHPVYGIEIATAV
jgi:hypothetical protein